MCQGVGDLLISVNQTPCKSPPFMGIPDIMEVDKKVGPADGKRAHEKLTAEC